MLTQLYRQVKYNTGQVRPAPRGPESRARAHTPIKPASNRLSWVGAITALLDTITKRDRS